MRFLKTILIFSSLMSGCSASQLISDADVDKNRLIIIAEGEHGLESIEDLSTEIGASGVEWLEKSIEGRKFIAVLSLPGTALINYRLLKGLNRTITVSLVNLYEQEPTQDKPSSPVNASYLDSVGINKAWALGKGSGVLVGVADDGIDYNHPDLGQNVFLNSDENVTPGDGVDNDKNGFIDDHRGWDFGRDDNDPKPEYFFHRHGTAVAGVIAGRTNQESGASGVAPLAQVLPLKFRVGARWNSVDIFRAFKYAADAGVRIINISYDVDEYTEDQLYLEAINYAYQKGVLIVNSAGNQQISNSSRQKIENVLIVCALKEKDNVWKLSDTSNYGIGIDVCAPSDVQSTVPNGKYASLSGTSFSAAIVSGIAALVWSYDHSLNRNQVVAKIVGTAIDADKDNPEFEGKIGSGIINAYGALTATPSSPLVTGVSLSKEIGSTLIKILFKGTLDPELSKAAHPILVRNDNNSATEVFVREFGIAANEIELNLNQEIQDHDFCLNLDNLKDPFGQHLVVPVNQRCGRGHSGLDLRTIASTGSTTK